MKNLKSTIAGLSQTSIKALLMLPFFFTFFLSCANDKKMDYDKRINAVKTAIEQKKIDSLQPYLANGFTIKGLPEGMESMILPLMLQKLPIQKRYTIDSRKEEKRGTRLQVTFYDAQNNPIKSNFLIAKDGKFLELNLLEDAKVSTSIK